MTNSEKKSNHLFQVKTSESFSTEVEKKSTEANLIRPHSRNSSIAPLSEPQEKEDKLSIESSEFDKKYGNNALFLFSDNNPFRLKLQHILSLKIYHLTIHILILLNSVFLIFETINSLEKLGTYSNIIFTVIFTIECIMKVIAYGFVLGENTYLRDAWNWLDFIVVITGILSFFPFLTANLLSLRTIRLIRPLKSIKIMPNMRLFIYTFINSLIDLGTVLLLMVFFFFIFGIFGLSMWTDTFHRRCRTVTEPVNGTLPLDPLYQDYLCGGTNDCGNIDMCINTFDFYPEEITKEFFKNENRYEKLNYGISNFENIGSSLFVVLLTTSCRGWTIVMRMVMDGDNFYLSAIYFVLSVVVNYYFTLYLTVAVLLNNFEKARATDVNKASISRIKEDKVNHTFNYIKPKKLKAKAKEKELLAKDPNNDSLNQLFENQLLDTPNSNEDVVRKKYRFKYTPLRTTTKVSEEGFMGFIHSLRMPKLFEQIPITLNYHKECHFGYYCYVVYNQPIVQFFIYFCIIFNSVILMLDRVDMKKKENNILETINFVLVVIFTLEIILLFCSVGFFNFIKEFSYVWDMIIVLVSIVEISINISSENNSSLGSIFRMMRIFRIFKLFRTHQNFQVMLESIKLTVARTVDYALLFVIFIYMYTLLGYSLFSSILKDEIFNFNSFISSFVSVFTCMMGDGWDSLFYKTYLSKKNGSKLSAYAFFVSLILLGNIIMLNIFLSYLINNFQRAKKNLENNITVRNFNLSTLYYCARVHEIQLRQLKHIPKKREKIAGVKGLDKCLQNMLKKKLLYEGFFVLNGRIKIDFIRFKKVKIDDSTGNRNILDTKYLNSSLNSTFNYNEGIVQKEDGVKVKVFEDEFRESSPTLEHFSRDLVVEFYSFDIDYYKAPGEEIRKKVSFSIGSNSFDESEGLSLATQRKIQTARNIVKVDLDNFAKKIEEEIKNKSNKEAYPLTQDPDLNDIGDELSESRLAERELENFKPNNSSSIDFSSENSNQIQVQTEGPRKKALLHTKTVAIPIKEEHLKVEVKKEEKSSEEEEESSRQDNPSSESSVKEIDSLKEVKINNKKSLKNKVYSKILPAWNYMKNSSLFIFHKKWRGRMIIHRIVYSKIFSYAIFVFIIGSCIMMCFDHQWLDPNSKGKKVVDGFNYLFNVIFIIEGLLKIISDDFVWRPQEDLSSIENIQEIIKNYQNSSDSTNVTSLSLSTSNNTSFNKMDIEEKEKLIRKATKIIRGRPPYIRDPSNLIDFVCIIFGIMDMTMSANYRFLRVLRVFRAVKPIRILARSETLNLMVGCLIQSLPAIGNLLLVCGLFVVIFGLLGVNLFKNKLRYYCTDGRYKEKKDCESNGFVWYLNPNNFNNFLASLRTTFEIILGDSWGVMMGKAGQKYTSRWIYWYYFLVVIIGNMFILNLVVCVMVQNFKILKDKEKESKQLSEPEKEWVRLQKIMGKFRPKILVANDEPTFSPLKKKIYHFVKSKTFDHIVIICILVSMIFLLIQYADSSKGYDEFLDSMNLFFTILFNFEIFLKLYVSKKAFFYMAWNKFDFIIVIVCDIMAIVTILSFAGVIGQTVYIRLPILLRAFNILRVLRVISNFSKFRALVDSLTYLIPSVANIGLLMFLLLFIYANIGMNIFGSLPYREGINNNLNFRGFFSTMVLLFEVTTKEKWSRVMYEAAYHNCTDPTSEYYKNDTYCFSYNITCYPGELVNYTSMKYYGMFSCGSDWSYVYFISFMIIGPIFMMNLCIVMVIEGFSESLNENEGLITNDYMEKFINAWLKYDTECERIIRPYEFVLMLKELHPPIGFNYDRYLSKPALQREQKYKKLLTLREVIRLAKEKKEKCTLFTETDSAYVFSDFYISKDMKRFTTETEVMTIIDKLNISGTEIKEKKSLWKRVKSTVRKMAEEDMGGSDQKEEAEPPEEQEQEQKEGENNKSMVSKLDKEFFIHFVDCCIQLSRFAISKMRNVEFNQLRMNIVSLYIKKFWIGKYGNDKKRYANLFLETKKYKEGIKLSVYLATKTLVEKLKKMKWNEERDKAYKSLREKNLIEEERLRKELINEVGSIISEGDQELKVPKENID